MNDPELVEVLPRFYGEVSKKLTPDFSTRDWLELHQRCCEGDITSMEMFLSLFSRKVMPNLDPEARKIMESLEKWKKPNDEL